MTIRVLGYVMARDEWPLLGLAITHGFNCGLAHIVVVDHASHDETAAGLERLKVKWPGRLTVIRLELDDFLQEATTRVIMSFLDTDAYDWVYVFDADEFALISDDTSLGDLLIQVPPEIDALRYELQQWVTPQDMDDLEPAQYLRIEERAIPCVFLDQPATILSQQIKSGHINFFDVPFPSKVVVRGRFAHKLFAGAHEIVDEPNLLEKKISAEILRIGHIPLLSWRRIKCKSAQGKSLIDRGFPQWHGWQNQMIHQLDVAGELNLFWQNHSKPNSFDNKPASSAPTKVVDDAIRIALKKAVQAFTVDDEIKFDPPVEQQFTDQFKLDKLVLNFNEFKYQVASLNQAVTERDEQIDSLNQALVERDEQVTKLNQALVERDAMFNKIVRSKSWLITKPFRWFSRICRRDFVSAADPFKKLIGLNDNAEISLNSNLSVKPSSDSVLVVSAPIHPTHPTAVILPVYRDVDMTKRCIIAAMPSVLADADAKLLAINDASPDVGMQEMLEQLASQWPDRLLVLKNASNLGFVRTVNRGLAYLSQYDVILLNSDVIVPNDWLSRLFDEAYSRPNIGTVTPFSNNATICSFPYFCQENAQPFDLDVDSIDSVFKYEKLPCIEAPTGVGFCMYIRRACLDKVGYLNEEKFGRGYGEENDLCQRALKSGWLNLISPNIYAFHEGGVSFSSDKQALVDRAMHVIDELHPNYHSDVQKFIKNDPIKNARVTRYVQLLASVAIPKVLHVSHSLGGGVKQHVEELGDYYGSRIANILVAPYGNKDDVSISLGLTPYTDNLVFSIPSNYENMLALLKAIGISAVHFHHTIGLDSKLLQLSTDLGVARLITVHDFYWLFGNPTLTDETGKYPGVYSDQLHNPLYSLPHGITVKAWQEQLRPFIEGADCVIFPSNSTKLIFENVYQPAKSVVAPHIEPRVNVNTSPINFTQRDAYTIGVLGALGKEKGADLLEQLAIKAKEAGSNFNFKLIGYAYRPLKVVEKTGLYQIKELKGLIKEHQLDIFLFTSQCPETYSYTLSYALDSGLPIIAPNIGAFPERLSGRTNVVLFDHLKPVSELLDILNEFVENMTNSNIVKAPVFENDISNHDFYSNIYLNIVSRASEPVEINKLETFRIDPSWIASEGLINKNSSWRNTVIHILWRLRMSPYLRWLTNAIPPKVRRAVRYALSHSNNDEVIRDTKINRS